MWDGERRRGGRQQRCALLIIDSSINRAPPLSACFCGPVPGKARSPSTWVQPSQGSASPCEALRRARSIPTAAFAGARRAASPLLACPTQAAVGVEGRRRQPPCALLGTPPRRAPALTRGRRAPGLSGEGGANCVGPQRPPACTAIDRLTTPPPPLSSTPTERRRPVRRS